MKVQVHKREGGREGEGGGRVGRRGEGGQEGGKDHMDNPWPTLSQVLLSGSWRTKSVTSHH